MAALGKVFGSIAKCAGMLKPSPGREQSDEGAGKQLLSGNYPSFGATRHLFPLLSLCGIFPRRGGNLSPRGEGFGGGCMVSGSIARCAASPEALPLGELARKRLRGRGRCPQRCAFAESGAANAVFRHDPTREKGIQKSPQAFLNPE